MKHIILSCFIVILFSVSAYADQVIYVEVSDFDPKLSQFDVDVKGNKWIETQEDGAINDTAFGAPGDNNFNADGGEPYLVIKLPEKVKQGESTADSRKWDAWARLYEPEMLVTGNLSNSIFLRTSPDAKNWIPQNRGSTDLLWNDAGGGQHLMFPDCVDEVDVFFTDVGDRLPWFWERHSGGGARQPDSKIDPELNVGDNYIELCVRESNPVNYPRIDVICFRNDGGHPTDEEALQHLKILRSVSSMDKLIERWGYIKSAYR
jgi:hypothetical protein